ncbi:HAD family hydrolase [Catellatospora bangladeshensis]|uniref:HAD family hydrolase n=1 Tax=Catellatospora bangladeshensis TaxID=310355 RepID=UPI00360B6FE3
MITTVAFDADDTLVDIHTAVTAGLSAVTAAVADPALTLELFHADADDHWISLADRDAREIRAAAMRYTLARAGREHELDRWLELFFEVRFAHSRPFEGATAVLDKLSRDYRLGYATNANSEAHRCGLGGRFAFEIYALRGGVPKKPPAGSSRRCWPRRRPSRTRWCTSATTTSTTWPALRARACVPCG